MTASTTPSRRPTSPGVPDGDARPAPRLVVLDVLRGVALCGIIWLNVPTITHWTYGAGPVDNVAPWLEPLFRGRFIGLFAALFGISFALVLDGASQRSPRPRLVLVRRFSFLLLLGLLHAQLQPGEVLTSYAFVGLILLVPLSYLRWMWPPLVLGVAAVVVALVLHLEPGQSAPGMVLLGYAGARLGLPRLLERPRRGVAIAALTLLAASSATVVLQHTVTSAVVGQVSYAYTWADFLAGIFGAASLATVVALALTTRLRMLLRIVFEPLGRLALTNYIGATLVAVATRIVSGHAVLDSTEPDLLLVAGVLALQLPVSRWWLARFRYGPLEWVWRCFTWWQVVPNRRPRPVSTQAVNSASSSLDGQ